jgi:GNAT superfamily N-acetyltransferase
MMLTSDNIPAIIEAFVEGWFVARSKGCSSWERIGQVWHVHYGVPMGGQDHEFFVYDTPIHEVIRLMQELSQRRGHWLAVFHQTGDGVEAEVAAADYNETVRETLMWRAAAPVSATPLPTGMTIQRVTTLQQVEWYNRTQGRMAIYPVELEEARLRYYLVYQGPLPVARGRLVLLDRGVFCLDGIHTLASYRRRGIGRAMVTQMMADAAAAGHPVGVLSSSEMGHPLYQQLGYQDILNLTLFEPGSHRSFT